MVVGLDRSNDAKSAFLVKSEKLIESRSARVTTKKQMINENKNLTKYYLEKKCLETPPTKNISASTTATYLNI